MQACPFLQYIIMLNLWMYVQRTFTLSTLCITDFLTQFVFSIAWVNNTNSNYSIGGADYMFAFDF